MDRVSVGTALFATTQPAQQKEAAEFLSQAGGGGAESESSEDDEEDDDEDNNRRKLPRIRIPTVSSDGSEWRRLAALSDDEDEEVSAIRRQRINTLMDRWRKAARRAVQTTRSADPWLYLVELPIHRFRRHRYSAVRQIWTEDIVECRMESVPFANGAMRECFRVKKLSSLQRTADWTAAHNYVAKRYMAASVERRQVFEDVRLQADAKLWAEEFNRHSPPKQIDIVQMCVLESVDGDDDPNGNGPQLFHLENLIEGAYVKYNSNSGWVSSAAARQTPHAFSHFTFERSGHQLMVVDIQGVGDLYTDPQIHTASGLDYGDGNLGTRGMALFFQSHQCNDICHSFCLSDFDLSSAERKLLATVEEGQEDRAKTMVRKRLQPSVCEPLCEDVTSSFGGAFLAVDDRMDAMEQLRRRTASVLSDKSSEGKSSHGEDCICAECVAKMAANVNLNDEDEEGEEDDEEEEEREEGRNGPRKSPSPVPLQRKLARHTLVVERPDDDGDGEAGAVGRRSRYSSLSADSSSHGRSTRDSEKAAFWARKQSLPAGVRNSSAGMRKDAPVLAQMHIDLARYHQLGRFAAKTGTDATAAKTNPDGLTEFRPLEYDTQSALFHLDVARRCGSLEAQLTVAAMCLDLPHELLAGEGKEEHWWVEEADEAADDGGDVEEKRRRFGFELMAEAAERGDRGATIFVAHCFETGRNCSAPSYPLAVKYLERLLGYDDEEEETGGEKKEIGGVPTQPRHQLLARMAELYREGGYGLEQDLARAEELYNEAAEAATEAMKGKLAAKYYEMAELCGG